MQHSNTARHRRNGRVRVEQTRVDEVLRCIEKSRVAPAEFPSYIKTFSLDELRQLGRELVRRGDASSLVERVRTEIAERLLGRPRVLTND